MKLPEYVHLGTLDPGARELTMRCESCHATRPFLQAPVRLKVLMLQL